MRLPDVKGGILQRAQLSSWEGLLFRLLGLALALTGALVVIQSSPLQAAAVVALAAVVVGAVIEPFVGLGAALFLGPLKAYLSTEVPQIPAQVGHAFVALALGSWLMKGLSEKTIRVQPVPAFLSLSLFGFLGAALLSLWNAVGLVAYGLPELIKWAELVVIFIFVKEHLTTRVDQLRTDFLPSRRNRRDMRMQPLGWLLAALLGTGIFQALVGIWQFGLRGEGPEHFRILGGDFFRAYGTFEQPNPYGGYLGLTTAVGLGLVLEATRAQWGAWYSSMVGSGNTTEQPDSRVVFGPVSVPLYLVSGAAVGAMLLALLASWSRGAWIGFGAATLAMTAALPRRTGLSVLLVAIVILGVVGLYGSGQLPSSFVARLTTFVEDIRLEDVRGVPINDANYAVVERLAHWQAALSMFRHNLWTGVGLGCYEATYPMFALINWPIALGHAHNIYLNLAAETGLIGLVAYLVLWGTVYWQTWRTTRHARGLGRGLAIGLLGAWTHLTVHHFLDNLYVNNVHLHIGALLGLAAFVIQQSRQTTLTDDC